MTDMEPERLRAEAKRFRSADPPRAIRGFDEDQTRTLLERAAELLDAAASEQEAARQELDELRSAAGDEMAGKEAIANALLAATHAGEEIAAEARISAARITAEAETRAAAILGQAAAAAEERERESVAAREKLQIELAGAHAAVEEQNAATRVELERERERLEHDQEAWQELLEGERTRALGEAQEKAATILADARHEVEQLQSYGERLRSLLTDSQRRFVEFAESALQQLERVDAGSASRHGDLLDDLRPVDGEPSASPSPATDPVA